MKQTRRDLIKNCSKITCVPIFSGLPKVALAQGQVPHFFIHCIFAGGMDPLYAFDARQLEMTDKGIFPNYTYRNVKEQKTLSNPSPIPVDNAERPGTFRSPLSEPLMKFKNQFTVFNGLHFKSDVHELNVPSMYFGNSAGGDNFVASIGSKLPGILDCVNIGNVGTLPTFGTNFGNSVALPRGNSFFGQSLVDAKLPTTNLPSIQQIMMAYERSLKQSNSFQAGVKSLKTGMERVPSLMTKFMEMAKANQAKNAAAGNSNMNAPMNGNAPQVGIADDNEYQQMIASGMQFLKSGITGAVNLIFDYDQGKPLSLDTHNAISARLQTTTFEKIFREMAYLFQTLNDTYYDQSKNIKMMDVTTLLITTEMGRTRKNLFNPNAEIDNTGTDHNAYSGSAIIAGKGIKGGMVIGESDLRVVDGTGKFTDASKAHIGLDKDLLRPMGLPFDHVNSRTVFKQSPDEYRQSDYLSIENVINTPLGMFGIPTTEHQRVDGRSAPGVRRVIKA